MRQTLLHILLISVVSGMIFFVNLGQSQLWDRDEPRNAGCAVEMLERGDWVVPMFNDQLRHQKPVLLYWLMIASYSVFGISEFSARFPSALLAFGTAVSTYIISRTLVSKRVALIASIALCSSLMFDVAARAATPDSVLIFCTTGALMFYVLGTMGHHRKGFSHPNLWFPSELIWLVPMFSMMGLAVLAKGPIGMLAPMAIIGMFMLIQRLPESSPEQNEQTNFSGSQFLHWLVKLRNIVCGTLKPFHPVHFGTVFWSMRPIMGTAIVLLVAAPWYWWVDVRTEGDFTQLFLVGENFGRATSVMENHQGGLWFYPVTLLVGFFPWSVFWWPVALDLFGRNRPTTQRTAQIFCLCWIGVVVAGFSLAQTKLPSYVTPCYPALAILTAIYVVDFARQLNGISQGWFRVAAAALVFSGLLIGLGFYFGATQWMPNQAWLAWVGLIPILTGSLLLWLQSTQATERLDSIFAVGAVLFCAVLFGFGPSSIDREQRSDQVLSQVRGRQNSPIGSFGCIESSWVFYAQRPIWEIHPSAEGYLISPQRKFWQKKPEISVEQFIQQNPTSLFLTTDEFLGDLQNRLPKEYQIIEETEYFLKPDRKIYLVGVPESRTADKNSNFKLR
ncbi:MAG: glycosyltransferase family 39 protein [Planctomycetota bacterium]